MGGSCHHSIASRLSICLWQRQYSSRSRIPVRLDSGGTVPAAACTAEPWRLWDRAGCQAGCSTHRCYQQHWCVIRRASTRSIGTNIDGVSRLVCMLDPLMCVSRLYFSRLLVLTRQFYLISSFNLFPVGINTEIMDIVLYTIIFADLK